MPYALRHKPTGNTFPNIAKNGQTFIEFVPLDKKPPRLWQERKDAQCFLTIWCNGPLARTFEADNSGPITPDNLIVREAKFTGYKGDPTLAPTPRIKHEYEVVYVHISFSEPST